MDPILAAVGQLQFDVVLARMKGEYGVDARLEPLPYSLARQVGPTRWLASTRCPVDSACVSSSAGRWVDGGWPAVEACGKFYSASVVKDQWGRPVLLFRNEFSLRQFEDEFRDKVGELKPYALPPDERKEKAAASK